MIKLTPELASRMLDAWAARGRPENRDPRVTLLDIALRPRSRKPVEGRRYIVRYHKGRRRVLLP